MAADDIRNASSPMKRWDLQGHRFCHRYGRDNYFYWVFWVQIMLMFEVVDVEMKTVLH